MLTSAFTHTDVMTGTDEAAGGDRTTSEDAPEGAPSSSGSIDAANSILKSWTAPFAMISHRCVVPFRCHCLRGMEFVASEKSSNTRTHQTPYCPSKSRPHTRLLHEVDTGALAAYAYSLGSLMMTWSPMRVLGPLLPWGSCGNIIWTLTPNIPWRISTCRMAVSTYSEEKGEVQYETL